MTEQSYLKKIQFLSACLHEKNGENIEAIDLSGLSGITEAILLVSGKNIRHVQALADYVLTELAERNMPYLGMEGYRGGLWILIDCNDILVHIFQESSREFYNLEGLFAEQKRIELKSEQM